MADLSPSAQAVLDAFWNGLDCGDDWGNANLAAVLRAAADQVVPPEQETPWGSVIQAHEAQRRARNHLLTIADELESING